MIRINYGEYNLILRGNHNSYFLMSFAEGGEYNLILRGNQNFIFRYQNSFEGEYYLILLENYYFYLILFGKLIFYF